MRALAALPLPGPGFDPAFAYCGAAPGWTFDPWVVTPLLIAGLLFTFGTVRLRRMGGSLRTQQVACYALGWMMLAGALLSPLHWLGEQMFTFHMIEHEIVMAISAPLLAIARPVGAALWALPKAVRAAFGRLVHARIIRHPWLWLTQPHNATFIHGAVLWLWHAPLLLDATITDVALHRLQHLSFLLSALLFWWALFRRARSGTAAAHLFITMLHMSILGALIALAPRVLYPVQTAGASAWGLKPLEDQQLAGLIMWVPAGTIYAGAALAFAALWIRRSGLGWRSSDALPR